ncbi:xenotropic and polytropic retrovirus receptor 1 homolog [Bolinopsis microptera]|uniref:xenotropic and polytropic retrovirus receptor 1 homolog n=1 Tax=Bolinopsis microptera TaxID=2820187 RepID=UPI003078BAC2
MKFGTELQAHLTPEWRQQYIEYEGLKTLLFSMLDKKQEYQEDYSDNEEEDPDVLNEQFDHSFFEGVMSEIKRINVFYKEKESDAQTRYTKLTSEFHRQLELLHHQSLGKETSDIKGKKVVAVHPARIKKLESKIYEKFRMAFSEYYLNLILLQNYQALNYTGFRKILKKYDKVMESKRGKKCFAAHVRGSYFEKSKEVEKLIESTEKFVTNTLEKGDRNKAMQKLRVPPLSGLELHEHSTTFKSGLMTWTSCFHLRSCRPSQSCTRSVRIFTAPIFPVQFADFFIADQLNSLATVLLDISFVFCYYTTYWSQGDEKCTEPGIWYRILIATLPPWFRFAQSVRRYFTTSDWFPHLVNAGKYFSSIVVIILANVAGIIHKNKDGDQTLLGLDIFAAYVVVACISTLYAYWWDIKMDWGFLDHTSTGHKNKYLRDELLYAGGKKFVYFIIMGLDLVLRCVWTINISLADWKFVHKQYVITGTALLEALRRAVWNFIRLENEHLNNCGQFRAVRDINVRVITEHTKHDEAKDEDSDREDIKKRTPSGTRTRKLSRAKSRRLSGASGVSSKASTQATAVDLKLNLNTANTSV